MEATGGDVAARGTTPPAGWYPDPAGSAQWRRWEGTTWGDATMPFGPRPPDGIALDRERAAWAYLRGVAPFALAAPALAAAAIASQSDALDGLRRWVRLSIDAVLRNQPAPPLPQSALPASSTFVSLAWWAVYVLSMIGVAGWLWFSSSSIRVAASAAYPQRHRPLAASIAIFMPIVGPLVAWSASRSSLPSGHEARGVLDVGWGLVVAGEATFLALSATVLSTASLDLAWAMAALCAVTWLAAAYELPVGLQAIADDHASLDVRARRAPS